MNRSSSNAGKKQQPSYRRGRCGKCGPCQSPDCGQCEHCLKKKKFGGDGTSRQACVMRGCVLIHGDPNAPGGQKYVKPKYLKPPPAAAAAAAAAAASSTYVPSLPPASDRKPPPSGSVTRVSGRNVRGSGGAANSMMRATSREPDSSSDTGGKGGISGGPARKNSKGTINSKRPFTFATELEAALFPEPKAKQQQQDPDTDHAVEQEEEHQEEEPTTKKIKRSATVYRTRFMGRKIPNPPLGFCAKCGQDDSMETVLLCDGNDCGREYHLSCAGLEDIPAGDWYCIDCSPTGDGHDLLVDYLEEMDEKRTKFASPFAFCVATLKDEIGAQKKVPESELVMTDPKKWIGKPVWMQVSSHTPSSPGRIVDHRVREYAGDGSREEHEYLIRFAAGHCNRKESYHHWIYLEEHSLMVGDDFMWAGNDPDELSPALIYQRSCRYLVNNAPEAASRSGSQGKASVGDSSEPTVTVGYFGRVGSEKFRTLESSGSALVRLDDTGAQEKFASKCSAQLALAMVEKDEQEEVVRWSKLPTGNPFHPHALKSRDCFTLPVLSVREPSSDQEGELHTSLCPLIMQGLDHRYILDVLEKNRGVQPTREMASNLTCQVIPYKWREPKSKLEPMDTEVSRS